jgi:Fe-S cluster assembly protein SufB
VAVDAIIDSVSVATTFKDKLAEVGVIFCSFSEAVREHPDLVRKYLGSVVPPRDNFFAALNSAVFTDGSFASSPPASSAPWSCRPTSGSTQGDRPVRAHAHRRRGGRQRQLPRGLHRAHARREPAARRGGRARRPRRRVDQVLDGAELVPRRRRRQGRHLQLRDQAGRAGARAKISWTQVETGSAITWKYPSVILQGDDSVGEFYSVAVTTNLQQADTGTKMIHIGRNTSSTIISKGISAGRPRDLPGPGQGAAVRHRVPATTPAATRC